RVESRDLGGEISLVDAVADAARDRASEPCSEGFGEIRVPRVGTPDRRDCPDAIPFQERDQGLRFPAIVGDKAEDVVVPPCERVRSASLADDDYSELACRCADSLDLRARLRADEDADA